MWSRPVALDLRLSRPAGGLVTRNGFNFADRFPKIVEAVLSLPARFCMIEGEAKNARTWQDQYAHNGDYG